MHLLINYLIYGWPLNATGFPALWKLISADVEMYVFISYLLKWMFSFRIVIVLVIDLLNMILAGYHSSLGNVGLIKTV